MGKEPGCLRPIDPCVSIVRLRLVVIEQLWGCLSEPYVTWCESFVYQPLLILGSLLVYQGATICGLILRSEPSMHSHVCSVSSTWASASIITMRLVYLASASSWHTTRRCCTPLKVSGKSVYLHLHITNYRTPWRSNRESCSWPHRSGPGAQESPRWRSLFLRCGAYPPRSSCDPLLRS